MKRSLVLVLLCSVAFSYAGETEEQKAACDVLINLMREIKTILARDQVRNLAQGIEEEIVKPLGKISQAQRSDEVKESFRYLLANIEQAFVHERLYNPEMTKAQYMRFREAYEGAESRKDHFSEECFSRIVNELRG